jgi:hypothetical protein
VRFKNAAPHRRDKLGQRRDDRCAHKGKRPPALQIGAAARAKRRRSRPLAAACSENSPANIWLALRLDRAGAAVTAHVIRFPMRNASAVFVMAAEDGWWVLVRQHGWLHGNYGDALEDAQWLAKNFGLPIREAPT